MFPSDHAKHAAQNSFAIQSWSILEATGSIDLQTLKHVSELMQVRSKLAFA